MYTESERRIYGPYWTDQGERFADPLSVQRKLQSLLGPDCNEILQRMQSPDATTALAAYEQFFQSIAFAFGVRAFDPCTGEGLMESELTALWNGFQEWLKKKATKAGNCPTSSQPTAGAGVGNGSPTKDTPGWCSTKKDNASAEPGVLPMA